MNLKGTKTMWEDLEGGNEREKYWKYIILSKNNLKYFFRNNALLVFVHTKTLTVIYFSKLLKRILWLLKFIYVYHSNSFLL